jgi:hypothetical protein
VMDGNSQADESGTHHYFALRGDGR